MKKINKGIVFSYDIERILNGYNAISYNYNKNGIIVPNSSTINDLRKDFQLTVNKIFNGQAAIITEEEMLNSINDSINDILGRYPHCLTR